MNKTVLVVIVLAVLLVGFMMYLNSQAQASKDKQMEILLANQGNQQEANLWSSMGDWAGIIGGIGGLFGSGSGDDDGEVVDQTGARLINTSAYGRYQDIPFPPTSYYATAGFDNLQNMVEGGQGVMLNG
jgi:hypothetical protein